MDRLPALDPKYGDAHRDMLAELCMLETTRNYVDRRTFLNHSQLSPVEVRKVIDEVLKLMGSGGANFTHMSANRGRNYGLL